MNLSKFIIYSLWLIATTSGWWALGAFSLSENAKVLIAVPSALSTAGWLFVFGEFLFTEFDN